MAAFTTGADWSFPADLPGAWDGDRRPEVKTEQREYERQHQWSDTQSQQNTAREQNDDDTQQQEGGGRRNWRPRTCRICLEAVHPTFAFPTGSSAIPASFQAKPRPVYASEDGGRLLRPCRCAGSQKYVHENCLQAWRLQDPTNKRNFFECPTCRYRYRLQRLKWGQIIVSPPVQVALTLMVFLVATFVLGFVADPIINVFVDPIAFVATGGGPQGSLLFEDEPSTWAEHFIKGLASVGLLGMAKTMFTFSRWQFFHRPAVYVRSGNGQMGSGRDRLNNATWVIIMIGVFTFLWGVWKAVRAVTKRWLTRIGENVMDVPGTDGDDDDDED